MNSFCFWFMVYKLFEKLYRSTLIKNDKKEKKMNYK